MELTDSLEIHLLELPKYGSPSDNGTVIYDPVDQWMYFFKNAKGSTPDALKRILVDPVFLEATGVLEMIARTPEERRLYNARLKMQLDHNSLVQAAKEEAEKREIEGKIEGKIEHIRTLQGILGEPVSDENELKSIGLERLVSLASTLQEKIRTRLLS